MNLANASTGLSGNLARLAGATLGIPLRSDDQDLLKAIKTLDQQEAYENGIQALRSGDTGQAIMCFEQLANDGPQITAFNLLAAQSLLLHMKKQGWDVGFIVRARRYLDKLKYAGYEGDNLIKLEKIYALLEKENFEENI